MLCPKCGNNKTVPKPGWFIRRCRVCGEEFVDPVRRLLISQIIFWIGAFFIGIIVLLEILQKLPIKAQQYGILAYVIILPVIAAFFIGRIILAGRKGSLDQSTPDNRYQLDDDYGTKEDEEED